MNILGIVPVEEAQKVFKNIQLVGGIPLIAHSINFGKSFRLRGRL